MSTQTTSSPPMPSSSSTASSPASSSMSSDVDDLSFDYDIVDGQLVRLSKTRSSKSPHSTPPTPPQDCSPLHIPRRMSLSRSESLPSATDSLAPPSRPLQRVASGPITLSTPAASAKIPMLSSTSLTGTARRVGGILRGAQRVPKDDAERRLEEDEHFRREAETLQRERLRLHQDEKENQVVFEQRASPPHGERSSSSMSSYGVQRPSKPMSIMKKVNEMGKINELEGSDNEHGYVPNNRPVSDINLNSRLHISQPTSRPSSSLGIPGKARRVTLEEKIRQDQEIAIEEARQRAVQMANEYHHPEAGSPTMTNSVPSGPSRRHQRRDSDTLRSNVVQGSKSESAYLDSQQQPLQPRISPSGQLVSGSSPPMRHRRSPTAPEAATTSEEMGPSTSRDSPRTWASGETTAVNNQSADTVAAAHARRKQMQMVQQTQAQTPAPPQRTLTVNSRSYTRLDVIGKGGSSRVYRVMTSQNEMFAIKKVALDKSDTETVECYLNEIKLLKKLEGHRRIIRLLDYEVKNPSASSRGQLMLVMECGEIDLARLLQERQKEPLDMVWVAYYWQQILQAVQVIHDAKIVHSDLKPANFVLVKGQVKLIDFGIANAIANDTTNIQRDTTVGTVNYMSPEAIEVPEGMRRFKVGRPSDVWSLGVILYQMVYGHPCFQHLNMMQKMKVIPDPTYEIDFPNTSAPHVQQGSSQGGTPSPPHKMAGLSRPVRADVIQTMKRCLCRGPKERATIPELLEDSWLTMQDPKPEPVEAAPAPPSTPRLKDDETVINPHYMRQLLEYAIQYAKEYVHKTEAEKERDAERLVQELKLVTSS